jgi:hypothetical protein
VVFPIVEAPFSVITDIPIRPELRNSGIGNKILDALIVMEMVGDDLRAYVDFSIVGAKRFF